MNFLNVSDDEKASIRKLYKVSENDIKRDIDIIKKWIKKQAHLPQTIEDNDFYERILLRNKCRVEKSKECIDAYYSLKTIWPEMFDRLGYVVPSRNSVICIPIVPLNEKKERVFMCGHKSPKTEEYIFRDGPDIAFSIFELFAKYEYCVGFRFVVDMQNFTFEHMKKMSPTVLAKLQKATQDAYSYNVKGIHFYRPPVWIASLLVLLKSVLPQKMHNRISVHPDMQSLHGEISKEILPKDYGGTQKSMKDLLRDWDKIFEDHKNYLRKVPEIKSNEKLRVGSCKYDSQMFGLDGTFKKLNLD